MLPAPKGTERRWQGCQERALGSSLVAVGQVDRPTRSLVIWWERHVQLGRGGGEGGQDLEGQGASLVSAVLNCGKIYIHLPF